MTTYYVAKTGNDSNLGTLSQPFLTVSAALTTSVCGDTISIRKGVYTDVWPYNKVLGRVVRSYQGEDVTIDCEGTRNYVISQPAVSDGTLVGGLVVGLFGLKFVNYIITSFIGTGDAPNGLAFDGSDYWYLKNCFFKPVSQSGSYGFDFDGDNTASFFTPDNRIHRFIMYNSFVGHDRGLLMDNNVQSGSEVSHNLFYGNTYNMVKSLATGGGQSTTELFDEASWFGAVKNYNAYPGMTTETHGINLTSNPFNNSGTGDYSLAPASSLRGAGYLGSNMGATFNPRLFVDNDLSELPLSAGSNDALWYDTGSSSPGTEGPTDAGPAIYQSGGWKIDNVSVPGAKSARVKFGPYNLPAGSKVKIPGWSALEDISLSSGSKQVIDFTGGTGTRDIQISINGGSKQTVTKNTNINQNASTVTFYVTLRADGV